MLQPSEVDDDDEWDDDIFIPPVQEAKPVEKVPPPRNIASPTSKELKVLKDNFGYSKFRPHQWEIISAVLSGRDQLVVMATGYGKSICFQFPVRGRIFEIKVSYRKSRALNKRLY